VCRSPGALRRALTELPPTLDETYNRILSAISEADKQYAVPILRWLAFSTRPLSVEELAEVVAIDLKDEARFDPEEVLQDPLDVLSICSSLVTMITEEETYSKPTRRIVVLAHYSVKEYLLSDRIGKGSAACYSMQNAPVHDSIARSCLGYLLQFEGSKLLHDDDAKDFRMADYSAKFWIKHAQAAGEQSTGYAQEAMVLFCKKKDAYLSWLRIHDPDVHQFKKASFFYPKTLETIPAPLYYATLAGLTEIVKLLIDQGADVNAHGGEHGSALQAAARKGHEHVVKLLHEKEHDVDASSARSGLSLNTTLVAASTEGHAKIVNPLSEENAGVDRQGEGSCSALQVASTMGHTQIVRLLLEKNANVEAAFGNQPSPLCAASARGDEQTVKLLLKYDAEVKPQRGLCSPALLAASTKGHKQIVKLLLEKSTKVDAQRLYRDAFYAASAAGHSQIVKWLLENDADFNVQCDQFFDKALRLAAIGRHVGVVKLLLEKGNDVNAQSGCYRTTNQVASWDEIREVARAFTGQHAEVDV
jgi:ankyrin repeat protein